MDRSYISATSSTKKDRARVELLKDLHRPLEEHWASAKQRGLDAMGSDYIYKHHLTRLEGIYNAEEAIHIDNNEPKGIANVSPMSQLYGNRGMLRGGEREDTDNWRREHGWDIHHTVTERINPCVERRSTINDEVPEDRQRMGASAVSRSSTARVSSPDVKRSGGRYNPGISPLPNKRPSSSSRRKGHSHERSRNSAPLATEAPRFPQERTDNRDQSRPRGPSPRTEWKQRQDQQHFMMQQEVTKQQQKQYQQQKQQQLNKYQQQHMEMDESFQARYRTDNHDMCQEELLLRSMYRLNPSQSNAYQQFVRMLIQHDTTDQLRIIEDAFKDAQVESLLSNFSGT
jgi:hypothetical protein